MILSIVSIFAFANRMAILETVSHHFPLCVEGFYSW